MDKNKKVIAIVVPHGDDEVLGFGGIIQKHVNEGDEVHVVFARKPIDNRTSIQYASINLAKKVLNYQHSHFLEMTEIEMSHYGLDFFRKLEKTLKAINPDTVYTTFYGDIHQDHKITFDWVCRAVRVWGPLNVKSFYVGEIPSSSDQYPTITGIVFTPNVYIPLSDEQIQKKVIALDCYVSEICEYPHPRSKDGVISKASIRGQECGNKYAEAFMCLRNIL